MQNSITKITDIYVSMSDLMEGRYRATCSTGPLTATMSTEPSVNAAIPAGIFFLSLRYVGPRTTNGQS